MAGEDLSLVSLIVDSLAMCGTSVGPISTKKEEMSVAVYVEGQGCQ